jgi:hypothetical protein
MSQPDGSTIDNNLIFDAAVEWMKSHMLAKPFILHSYLKNF